MNKNIKPYEKPENFFKYHSMSNAIATGKMLFNPKRASCIKEKEFSKHIYVYTVEDMERNPLNDKTEKKIAEEIYNHSMTALTKNFSPVSYMDIPVEAISRIVTSGIAAVNDKDVCPNGERVKIQREGNIMSVEDASWLIVSMLNRRFSIPEVTVYVYKERNTYVILIIDGQQRLVKLSGFIQGKWAITGTGTNLDGHYFSDFPSDVQEIINESTVHFKINNEIKNGQEYDDFLTYNEKQNKLRKGENINARITKSQLYFELADFANKMFAPKVMQIDVKSDKRMEFINHTMFTLSNIFLGENLLSTSNKNKIVDKMLTTLESVDVKDVIKANHFKKMLSDKDSILYDVAEILNSNKFPHHFCYSFNTKEGAKDNMAIYKNLYAEDYNPTPRTAKFSAVNGPVAFIAVYMMLNEFGMSHDFIAGDNSKIFVTELEKHCKSLSTRNPSYKKNYDETAKFVKDYIEKYHSASNTKVA